MLRLIKDQKGKPLANEILIQLDKKDSSLSPLAEGGDSVLVAQLMTPQDRDLLAYEHNGKYFVRWWRQDETEFVTTDAEGESEERLPFADVLVLGVVIEIRRPIANGWPLNWDQD